MAAWLLATAVARAQAPLPATTPSPDPVVRVDIGLAGFASWGRCAPIRVEIAGGTQPFAGTLLVRCSKPAPLWKLPLTVEAGGRRTLSFTSCDSCGTSWQWSLDGTTWTDVTLGSTNGVVVAIVGESIGRMLPLEEALGASWATYNLSAADHAGTTLVLPPEHAPADPSGWDVPSLIVLDAAEAPKLAPEAVTALRDRVLSGALLVVAGTSDPPLPPELLAARAGGIASDNVPAPDGGEAPIPVLDLVLHSGATPLVLRGRERSWAAVRPLGLGRIVRLGIDLTTEPARAALDADAWRTILDDGSGSTLSDRPQQPGWVPAIQSRIQSQGFAARMTGGIVPPIVAAAYLLAGVVAVAGVAAWRARRNGGAVSRPQLAAILAVVAVPGFVAGLFRHRAAPQGLVVIEHFAASRTSRFLSCVVATGSPVSLPPGAVRPMMLGGFGDFPESAVVLGPAPSFEGPAPDVVSAPGVVVESWRPQGEDVVARLAAQRVPRRWIRGGTTGDIVDAPLPTATAPRDMPDLGLLDELPYYVDSSQHDVLLALEPGPGGVPTAWIVRVPKGSAP